MAVDFRDEAPAILKDYLIYKQTIKNMSKKTVDEYFIDLRTFFRFLKVMRGLVPDGTEFDEIKIDDVDLDLIKTVNLELAYDYMNFLYRDRNNKSASRARKCSSLKGFFKYITNNKHLLDTNPVEQLESPKNKKALPKYLTLEQSIELLNAVDGNNKQRDYCILTLFLNCGLRVSEMAGLNYNEYMKVRPIDEVKDKKALFISRNHRRMSVKTIQAMVYKYLEKIGLDSQGYSCHKLRHTAATLMYQQGGVDVRVLKEVLGHENLGTTEIYTHLSSEQMKNAADSNPLAKIKPKKKV